MKLDEAVATLAEDETLTKGERWKLLMEILKMMETKIGLLEERTKPPRHGRVIPRSGP